MPPLETVNLIILYNWVRLVCIYVCVCIHTHTIAGTGHQLHGQDENDSHPTSHAYNDVLHLAVWQSSLKIKMV